MRVDDSENRHIPLLWGDFRVFLAGREPTADRISAFAAAIESAQTGHVYGLPVTGCADAVVMVLTKQIAA